MTLTQQFITIGICVVGTAIMRFLPFIVFSESRPTPAFVQYLGRYLPAAVFSMLVIYCLKDVSIFTGTHAIPELIAMAATAVMHKWKHQMILSISTGTILYMILLQLF
jgi:branched-subunit amino acid transport protein AzlD